MDTITIAEGLRLRPVELDDYDTYRAMVLDYDPDIEPIFQQAWAKIHDHQFEGASLVALVGEQIVGFMQFNLHQFFFHVRPVCYLSDMYIREPYRRRGYARAMLSWLIEYAKEAKWERLYWVTEVMNIEAQGLYDSYGSAEFIRYHRDL